MPKNTEPKKSIVKAKEVYLDKATTFKELGVSGLDTRGGKIYEEHIRNLQGANFYKAMTEMEMNSPVVGAILFAITNLTRTVDYYWQPSDQDSKASVEAADFFQSIFDDLQESPKIIIADIIREMIVYGFALREKVYKRRYIKDDNKDGLPDSRYNDGKIGVAKLAPRAANTVEKWLLEPNGDITGFVQRAAPSYKEVAIPIHKILHFRTTLEKNNPQGRSALRNAYKAYYYGKNIEEFEGIGIERDLAGFPVIYAPPEVMAQNPTPVYATLRRHLDDAVVRMRAGEQAGIILPYLENESGNQILKFDLIKGAGGKLYDTDKIITRYNTLIATTLLADFILLGHSQTGSFALSSDKTSLFALAISGWLDEICDTFNRQFAPQVCALNGIDLELAPALTNSDLELLDMSATATALSSLFGSGLLENSDELQEFIHKKVLGIAKPE